MKIIDHEGFDLPDLETARSCALELARRLIAAGGDDVLRRLSWRIDITDEDGALLHTVLFDEALATGTD